jgi:hypothetical protein
MAISYFRCSFEYLDSVRSAGTLGPPDDHRPARTRHPDAIALEPGVQLAAVFVLADEGLEGGAEGILAVHRASIAAIISEPLFILSF